MKRGVEPVGAHVDSSDWRALKQLALLVVAGDLLLVMTSAGRLADTQVQQMLVQLLQHSADASTEYSHPAPGDAFLSGQSTVAALDSAVQPTQSVLSRELGMQCHHVVVVGGVGASQCQLALVQQAQSGHWRAGQSALAD